jgi:hypothetical protein
VWPGNVLDFFRVPSALQAFVFVQGH